ncbi:hypothetical protein ACFWOT_03270 [Streptomyces sp. NPDC058440]|uniref:hypothetical protein n=1 Tax=Streptomyces sp. NPDC058440 TaxID=3346501 RepID=UPI00365EB331
MAALIQWFDHRRRLDPFRQLSLRQIQGDSSRRGVETRSVIVLFLLSAGFATVGVGLGLLAVLRPTALVGEGTDSSGERFYVRFRSK